MGVVPCKDLVCNSVNRMNQYILEHKFETRVWLRCGDDE